MRQSSSIIFLSFALLLNASSNVFAATFCPRAMNDHDCCFRHAEELTAKAADESSCAHDMSGMDMDMAEDIDSASEDSAAELKADSVSDQNELVASSEPCQHCLSHSQASSTLGVATVGNASPQSTVADASVSNLGSHLPIRPTGSAALFRHGPPGNSLRLYTLLNVFRI